MAGEQLHTSSYIKSKALELIIFYMFCYSEIPF